MIVAEAPAASVPTLQGKALQAPLLESQVRPAGVGSDTVTPTASDGPRFVTVTVYVTWLPANCVAVPLLATERSACAVTTVVTDAVLLAGYASPVVDVTVAVLTIEPPAFGAVAAIGMTAGADAASEGV